MAELGLGDPLLPGVRDKIPILRVFAQRLRDGRLSRSGQPISASHVRDEVLHLAKTFTELGAPDPRLTPSGVRDSRLTRQYKGMSNQDPAPNRVKPLPIQIVHHAHSLVTHSNDVLDHATIDMIWIALFFLLRPGEYCKANDNNPLLLEHVTLLLGSRRLNLLTAPAEDLLRATHSSLTFDDQKNRERGEVIGHGRSGHSIACPTRSLARRVLYLRQHGATLATPLCAVRGTNKWIFVTSRLITAILRVSAAALPHLGFAPSDISARSLRAGGAMALLCGGIDRDVIRLVGRWKSDAMFRYLHAQALPLVRHLASTMLRHGNFTLLPGSDLPNAAATILQAVDTTAP